MALCVFVYVKSVYLWLAHIFLLAPHVFLAQIMSFDSGRNPNMRKLNWLIKPIIPVKRDMHYY